MSAEEFQQSDLFKFLNDNADSKNEFSIRSHAAPLIKSVEAIDLSVGEPSKAAEVVSFQSSHDTPMNLHTSEQSEETTLARRNF